MRVGEVYLFFPLILTLVLINVLSPLITRGKYSHPRYISFSDCIFLPLLYHNLVFIMIHLLTLSKYSHPPY